MKFSQRFTPLAVALGALAFAGAVHAADTIKIGIPQPMTGPNTQYGDQIQAGALTAIETINAKGGVKGKKLEPILIDDGCRPKQAVPAANRVVNSGAKFAVAHACSGVTVAAVNVYEQEGIVAITPGATSSLVTDTIKPHFFFRTIGRDDQQGRSPPATSPTRSSPRRWPCCTTSRPTARAWRPRSRTRWSATRSTWRCSRASTSATATTRPSSPS